MSNSDKRQRKPNFSEYEKNLLIELVKQNDIIVSKQKDISTSKKKDAAWKIVLDQFNQDDKVNKRDIAALLLCMKNLTNKAKMEHAQHKRERNATGGGPCPVLSSTSAEIVNIMPSIFQPLLVNDSDAAQGNF